MRSLSRFLFCACVALCSTSLVTFVTAAEAPGTPGRANLPTTNWPQFRGPLGSGHVLQTGLPEQWDATKNIAWKTALPGNGWSSPVLVDNKLYLTAAVPVEGNTTGDLSLRALCLAADTGAIEWNHEVFLQEGATAPKIHGKNSHASPTAVVEGKRIYVHFGHQGTACLDLQGKVLWGTRDLKYPPVHGNGSSPILVGPRLVLSCDGGTNPFIVALDTQNGSVLWKTARETKPKKTFAFCTPAAIEVNGQTQIVSPYADAVSAYDPVDGHELWRVRYNGYSIIPKPVFGHGLVFISTCYDSPVVMAIRPDGTGDVTDTHVAWTQKRGAPNTPALLLVEDELYMVSDRGVATCLDAKTGEIHWQERLGGNFSSSPTLADSKIFFQSEEGVCTVVRASKTYEKLTTSDLAERSLASFAAGDRCWFIRTDKHLYRVEEKPTDATSAAQ